MGEFHIMKKKLIEVALPLDAINAAAAYEKMPGIGAHPRGLHLWWARRPLTAARAVIWASLVDDPSSHPEIFPTEKEQDEERNRLFGILEELVQWKNSNNEHVLNNAKAEIMKYTGNHPPALLDPFSGGGAIPLEAQRLGLKAYAHDLNPVAVMINKAMIEIPAKFVNQPPVNPEAQSRLAADWHGAQGLANDIAYYGNLLKERAFAKIGHLYPKVKVPETGQEATVIAWLWARTVKCPNPACGCDMPLVKSFWLSKKAGKEAYLEPLVENGKIRFAVQHGKGKVRDGTVTRTGAQCIVCGASVPLSHIRNEAKNGCMGAQLIAIVAKSQGGRLYLAANEEHRKIADVPMPKDVPAGDLPEKALSFRVQAYGIIKYSQLFTNRQLNALTTFSNLICDMQSLIYRDAERSGKFSDEKTSLGDGGKGAWAYGQAVGVYLSFAVDRLADFSTSVSRWAVSNEKAMNLFNKQAIPMTWDYPEVNMLGNSVGSVSAIIEYLTKCIETLPNTITGGIANQIDAQTDCGLRNIMVSTDPPYYDNIGYADLSDFFYIWLRHSLRDTYPNVFSTMLVPKSDELIANPYRFGGSKQSAKDFFEHGMAKVCRQIHTYAQDDYPVTIYYAFKQNDMDEDGTASSGWETMLNAIIQSGFSITGTWPIRTEQVYRSVGMGTNALASSIVLVCRKREAAAATCTRKNFLRELNRELASALAHLQASNIAPVDMAQSAIGPGISVYSRYAAVLESDGSPMTVRSALKLINQALDDYFHGQGENLDAESRFAVDLYAQCGFNEIAFGEADVLARARNVAMNRLQDMGIVHAAKGKVRLKDRDELPSKLSTGDSTWLWVQTLVRELEKNGIEGCAKRLSEIISSGEGIKHLAYRLYQIADKKGWAQEGTGYNNLVISWPDIMMRREEFRNQQVEVISFDF